MSVYFHINTSIFIMVITMKITVFIIITVTIHYIYHTNSTFFLGKRFLNARAVNKQITIISILNYIPIMKFKFDFNIRL